MLLGGGSWRALSGWLAIFTMTGTLACGSGDDGDPPEPEPRHPLTQVVHSLQDRFHDEDIEGVCALMTRSAQIQAGEVGHGTPTNCPRDLRRAFGMIEKSWLDEDDPRVSKVLAGDRTATVLLASDDWTGRIPFAREGGQWRLAGFFGMSLPAFERLEDDFPSRPFPTAGKPVQVADGDGTPCAPIEGPRYADLRETGYPKTSGGCEIRVSKKAVPIEMMTPFGGFKFSDCNVTYDVRVDRAGRTWIDEFEVESANFKPGPGADDGCADVNPCIHERGSGYLRLPWKGQIRSDGEGGFAHHVDMCVRTCIGMFVGGMVLDLTPDDDASSGWRAEPSKGVTGYRYDDSLDIAGEPLQIAEAGATTASSE